MHRASVSHRFSACSELRFAALVRESVAASSSETGNGDLIFVLLTPFRLQMTFVHPFLTQLKRSADGQNECRRNVRSLSNLFVIADIDQKCWMIETTMSYVLSQNGRRHDAAFSQLRRSCSLLIPNATAAAESLTPSTLINMNTARSLKGIAS